MLRRTGSGSLYGNVDVLGKPTNTKGRKGIIPQYRLISSLRLHPSRKTLSGCAPARPRSAAASVLLPVRNLGNTIDPIARQLQAQPARRARNGTFKGVAALPGKLVALGLGATRGLKKGRYTVNATVTQGGRRVNARTSFTIR